MDSVSFVQDEMNDVQIEEDLLLCFLSFPICETNQTESFSHLSYV